MPGKYGVKCPIYILKPEVSPDSKGPMRKGLAAFPIPSHRSVLLLHHHPSPKTQDIYCSLFLGAVGVLSHDFHL